MGEEIKSVQQDFLEKLENSIDALPQNVREEIYRPCARSCVENYVIPEMRRQFEECGRDLDEQYKKYGRSEFFFADIIEPGHIYEIGYPRCVCSLVEAGTHCPGGHCECSRQSILYVYECLSPEKKVDVEMLHTVLTGANECRFRVTVEQK